MGAIQPHKGGNVTHAKKAAANRSKSNPNGFANPKDARRQPAPSEAHVRETEKQTPKGS